MRVLLRQALHKVLLCTICTYSGILLVPGAHKCCCRICVHQYGLTCVWSIPRNKSHTTWNSQTLSVAHSYVDMGLFPCTSSCWEGPCHSGVQHSQLHQGPTLITCFKHASKAAPHCSLIFCVSSCSCRMRLKTSGLTGGATMQQYE